MTLAKLLQNVAIIKKSGALTSEILGITDDSREVKKDYVFIAYQGVNQDGHQYIPEALKNGAKVIVGERPDCQIQVKDGREAVALIAANWYGNPAKKLKLIGVTGTNGKTSTSRMIKAILESSGLKVGILGTIGYDFNKIHITPRETTPDAITLHNLFRKFVDAGCEYVVLEATSQGLAQKRLAGLEFAIAVFTNLTQDHLDYHQDMADYLKAKMILFEQARKAVLNADDLASKKIAKNFKGEIIKYSLKKAPKIRTCPSGRTLFAPQIRTCPSGRTLFAPQIRTCPSGRTLFAPQINLKMPGQFNQRNALAAIAAVRLLGIKDIKEKIIKNTLARVTVPGRFELVGDRVIVDYAHTPDALEWLLKSAREIAKNKLICVFGCGGDRDKTKRPKMGKIATNLADYVIVTSDNPRTEDSGKIITDIKKGIKKRNYQVIENRAKAIQKAIKISEKNDLVVIAGKGHEDYQIIGERRIHFDDREQARKYLKIR